MALKFFQMHLDLKSKWERASLFSLIPTIRYREHKDVLCRSKVPKKNQSQYQHN